jgi:hypothetical protein
MMPIGVIVDTLHLGREELAVVISAHPDAVVTHLSNTHQFTQHDQVIIPSDDCPEEDYYVFPIDNSIAMSSTKFCLKVETDPQFAVRMRARIA